MIRTVLGVALLGAILTGTACSAYTPEPGSARRNSEAGAAGASGAATGAPGVKVELPSINDNGEVDPGTACVADARAGEKVPIDLYFMVDKSGSMKCRPDEINIGTQCQIDTPLSESRWLAVTTALENFVKAPDNTGLGVGMDFFPRISAKAVGPDPECIRNCSREGEGCACVIACGCEEIRSSGRSCLCLDGPTEPKVLCEASDYTHAAVEIAVLPAAALKLVETITQQDINGGTPTVPALQGAFAHAAQWSSDHPGKRVAVVYVTDGEPFGCDVDNTIETATSETRSAANGAPGIATYVIGIGPSLDNLNRIAEAGGTEKAYLLDGSSDAAKALSDALNSIRSRTLSCDYAIPKDNALDFAEVNVRVGLGAGSPTLISQTPSRTRCSGKDGWYYDDPTDPTLISLCPKTCNAVRDADEGQLEVLIGCKTITDVPK